MPSVPCPHCGEVACMRAGGETCINKNVPRFGGRPDSYQAEPTRSKGRRGKPVESEGTGLDPNAPETPYTFAQSDIESDEQTPTLDPDQIGGVTITENNPDQDDPAKFYGGR